MKRFSILLLFLIALAPIDLSAQHYLKKRVVGAVEGDIGVGLATAANRFSNFGKARQGVDVNAEVRYNFHQAPVDLGVHFALCSFKRGESVKDMAKSYNFNSQNLLITSDYNLFQGNNISLFFGLGAGVAWSELTKDSTKYGFNFCAMPRIGVEFSHNIRITAAYKFFERANNHLTISVGFAIGGGRR